MTHPIIRKGDCPHCGAENTAFSCHGEVLRKKLKEGYSEWDLFMSCNGCSSGVIVRVVGDAKPPLSSLPFRIYLDKGICSTQDGITFFEEESFPKPPTHEAPDDVPDRIASVYLEASDNLYRQRYETSEMLSRKVLELATKYLHPEGVGALAKRIDLLKAEGLIAPQMADWAHAIRLDANESVHTDNESNEHNAGELLAFTKTFLMYVFTLPAMIERRKLNQ